MDSKDQPTRYSNLRSVSAQTGRSFLWKLAIVSAGVIAYNSLNTMESRKSSYDKARNAPIVIVDELATSTETSQQRNSIELTALSVKKFFKGDQAGTTRGAQATPLPSPVASPVTSTLTAEDVFVADMQGYVDRAKYQPFKNGDELLDRLNQEILKDEAAEERVRQQQQDIIDKQYVARQTALLTQKHERCPAKEQAEEPTKANHVRSAKEDPTPVEDLNCTQLDGQITNSEDDHTQQSQGVKEKFASINQLRERRVRSVYEGLRPKLLAKIEEEKGRQTIRSFAYFFPANVLDERNGIHVIYSIFWLTCMVILIFGVLFLILLVLRPLPPFAGGAEALSEQARSFLSRRSATPELAKTLIATTAALGIGTAVAVAGGMNMPTPVGSSHIEIQYPYGPDRIPAGEKPGVPPPVIPYSQASPEINVTAVAPVTYTTPMTINIPSSEGPRIEALAWDIGTLDGNMQTLKDGYTRIDSDVRRIDTTVTNNLQPLVATLDKDSKRMDFDRFLLQIDAVLAKKDIVNLQEQSYSLKSDFFTRMDSFNGTLQDIRSDQLRQSRPLGATNIFAKATKLLSVGSERYLVTDQSYRLLRSLMCNRSVELTPAAINSPSATPTAAAPCSLGIKCDCGSDLASIFKTLRTLIGREPMSEGQFMREFSPNDQTTLKSWKPVLLKYTRVV